jgi:Flp pilus assembly protein TadD
MSQVVDPTPDLYFHFALIARRRATMIDMSGFSSGPRLAGSDAEAELQWATAALNHGRPDEAERFAASVLARIPQHPKALYLLGCALLRQNRAAQAVAPLERAARALQDAAVETQLGIALRQVGRTDDALARLRRATKRRPAHPEAFHELGYLLSALGRGDEAVTVVEHGIQLAPGGIELLILLGVIHQGRRDRAKAKAAFAQALAIAPDHPGAHFGMGTAMVDDAEYAQAAEHLRRALASNAADAQALLGLGVCLLELGRVDDALGNFRAAVRSDPSCYGTALTLVSGAGRGRFWLRPSTAAKHLSKG